MNKYYIKTVDKKDFSLADTVEITNYNWMDNDYRPKTQAWVIFVKGEGFHVRMRSYEKNPRVVAKKYMGAVYEDACMEFFFNFNPDKVPYYVNFECNAIGTLNSSRGKGRIFRKPIKRLLKGRLPEINATIEEEFWQVEYLLPIEYLEKLFGEFSTEKGTVYRGNFYKCGDKTIFEHYGSWSPITLPKPNFHCPNFFGELIMD